MTESKYKAEFLWPHEDGSIEEAGYEFANGKSEDYVKKWWEILLERALGYDAVNCAVVKKLDLRTVLRNASFIDDHESNCTRNQWERMRSEMLVAAAAEKKEVQ